MTVSTETVRMAKSRPRKNQSERTDLPCHIIMMYKIVNNMLSDYLSSHFVFRSDTLTKNGDSDCSPAIPQPRTNYCKRSLSYSGAVPWNRFTLGYSSVTFS